MPSHAPPALQHPPTASHRLDGAFNPCGTQRAAFDFARARVIKVGVTRSRPRAWPAPHRIACIPTSPPLHASSALHTAYTHPERNSHPVSKAAATFVDSATRSHAPLGMESLFPVCVCAEMHSHLTAPPNSSVPVYCTACALGRSRTLYPRGVSLSYARACASSMSHH